MPAILLPSVRAVKSIRDMVTLGKHLPAEADEALLWLAEGIPPDEIREAVAMPTKKKVDPADLAAALEHPDTKRRFVTIQTDDDLTAMLEAPLEKWRVFLHPSQERLVSRVVQRPGPSARAERGPARRWWRCTGPGTWQRRSFTGPADRILFTTYTANLAENIEATLNTFCGAERQRIEVVHLHAWAVRFLRSHGDEKDIASPEDIEACWKEAIHASGVTEFDASFLRKEWEEVVLSNGIEDREAYLKVSRLGRGKTLSRPQRGRAWQVFERYQAALARRNRLDWLSLIRQARRVLEAGQTKPPFRAVVVDEAQDFHPEEWRLIRALVPAGGERSLRCG